MTLNLIDYKYGFRIVSLALDNLTKEDLHEDGLDFIWVTENGITLFPEAVECHASSEDIDCLRSSNNYDVFELWPDGKLILRFDTTSLENNIFQFWLRRPKVNW